ncbi:MAG: RsmD family RNA methyltransferase [bacterium]|nr:RsmD family RNA methyltransferase [bacterium]
MRIISGTLKGRIIAETHGHRTHPMSEKIRGALFNALGDIHGLTIFDAYAGTGAISFEAISRGADHATSIDLDKSANRTIIENADALVVSDKITVIKAAATSWARRHPNSVFDIVVLDPPFDAIDEKDLIKLMQYTKVGGIVVLSVPPYARIDIIPANFEQILHKTYGDAVLAFYRRLS